MRSTNPVLSRSDAFTPGHRQTGFQNPGPQQYARPGHGYGPQQYGQPVYGAQAWGQPSGYAPQGQAPAVMTINDVLAKTGTLFVVLLAAAAVSWLFLPTALLYPVAIVSSLVAVVTSVVVTVRHSTSVPAIMVYTVAEGLMLGAWSRVFEYLYPGIVSQAVLGTLAATAVVLAAYRYLGVRVTGRLRRIVVLSVIAYAVVALVNFAVVLLGGSLGLTEIGSGAGMLSWLFAGIGVTLAVMCLLMDLEECERGVRMGAPAKESWRAGFGLMVTLVWLYTNILRILSFLRN
ncbi:Bax inhibitor-1/YccA family protein [Propionibacterium acidifaciens]|uniref:Bax inhibitor-1/YccA family protein n=1 Tax=Propionibacterium acidifaciens TaxID=556499 RepID=UPI0023F2430F|nr:Bax inhibitor-1/YccA family protein [Propionibacterium acidifaciens]